MPIPQQKNRRQELERKKLEIEYELAQNAKTIRRLLCQAMQAAVEAAAGSNDAQSRMEALLDDAYDAGLADGAITIGPNMPSKIAAVIDRPEPQAHAVGLLLNAAELLDLAGFSDDATSIRGIATNRESANDHYAWRTVATPTRRATAEERIG